MSNKSIAKKSASNTPASLTFILFNIVITLPLLFRGLYFERELLPSLISIYIVFIIWAIYKSRERDFRLFSSPVDYLFLAMVVLYLLSISYGVHKREALLEFSRYLGYFALFQMAKDFATKERQESYIVYILLFAGLMVSVIGIGAAIGTWEYMGAVIGNRLSSTFQYPNTLGAYVGALYFLALTMLIRAESRIEKSIFGALMGIYIFTLILTLSRAMFLIFPLSFLLYFIIMPNRTKMEALLYGLSSIIISSSAVFLFNSRLADPSGKLWALFFISFAATGLLVYLISLLQDRLRNMSIRRLITSLGILGLVLVMAAIYIINATTSLTLENNSEENATTTIIRKTSSTLPDNSYRLELDYSGENHSQSNYFARITVYNVNSDDSLTLLLREDLTEIGEKFTSLDFTTLEDSSGIRVYFQNTYPATRVEFYSANIVDIETEDLVSKIPLKYKYLGENFVRRVQSISAGEGSFTARMTFNKDGLKIIGERPILGTGGGGWLSIYQKHQSYPYSTALAHNFVLQMWIEIGSLGFIIFLAMMAFILLYFFISYKRTESTGERLMLLGIAITIATMLIHAIVDFDMSLPAYAIVFWVLMGLLVNRLDGFDFKKYRFTRAFDRVSTNLSLYALIFLVSILIANSSSIVYSERYKVAGAQAFEDQDLDLSVENFEKVVKFDRYEGTYKMDLASLYMGKYRETDDLEYVRKAVNLVDQYLQIVPYDAFAYGNAASFNFSIGEIEKGLEQLDISAGLQPMRTEIYLQKVDGYRSVIDFYINEGNTEKARSYLQQALLVKEDIERVNSRAYKPLKVNNSLVDAIGQLQYLYDNIDRIGEIYSEGWGLYFAYYFDLDINNDGNIDMLATSKPTGSEIDHQIIGEEDYSFMRITNPGENHGFKYITPISLQPNTSYALELKARGTANPDRFNLYAWSSGAENANQGELTGIELTGDWRTIRLEFTTDADIEPGRQYIRIQHNGGHDGYIDVRDLVIFAK
ncbi:MAG: O-antigen ligase family protein [Tissierellaceae bacterium]